MSKRQTPKDWLYDYLLRYGPTRRNEIAKIAKAAKICGERTLDRAAEQLGIPRGWHWRLPD